MPEFSNPFAGNKSDHKLSKEELIRAIRYSIAAEFEASQLYEQLSDSIDNEEAKKILEEVSDDEKVHAGNFLKLLHILEPEEEKFHEQGYKEAMDIIKDKEDK